MLNTYIDSLKQELKDTDYSIEGDRPEELKETIKVAEKFKQLADRNKDMELEKSPYSNSFYLIPKNSKVSWGRKPEGSYRFSNHWNWTVSNEYTGESTTHCPTNTGEDFDIAIGQYKEGKYYLV